MATTGMGLRVFGAAGLVAGLMAGSMAGGSAHAQERLVGYVEYQSRRETREGGGRLSTAAPTLRVDGYSYVWEPWFADIAAGVGLTSSGTRQGDASQTGLDVTGGARLRMFPRSTFPFEVYADRIDTRISGDIVGPEYSQTVLGITQSYSPKVGARYAASYRHMERDDRRADLQPAVARTTDDFLSLSASRAYDHNTLDARVDYDHLVRDVPQRADTRQVGIVRHRYSADSSFSVDTLASIVDGRTDDLVDHSRSTLNQWNSNLFWRPATTRPLLVTGSVVMSGVDSENNGSGVDARTMVGTAGVSWQYTPSLAVRSNVSATRTDVAGSASLATFARAGLNYSPLDIPIGPVSYRHAASADAGHRTDDRTGLSVVETSGTLSHGVAYSRPFEGGSASAMATQMMTTLRNGAGLADSRLIHSASVDWSVAGITSFGSLRLLASDTHRIEPEQSSFQLLNLQAAGRYQITRLAGWQGSLTVQSTHSEAPGAATPWVTNASASIVYRHERLFGIPLLRFTSEFRALSDELAQSTRDGFSLDHRARWLWSNRLDYVVGRLQISVRGSVGEVDGRGQTLLFFMVRRYFAQLPQ